MNITFNDVTLKNFMSYEDETVFLERNGYVLVSGINNNPDDNAKSNGTGKSSLFSAISWALTGLTVSGGKSVENIHTEGTTEVTLNFTLDETHYKVVRTKNPSNLKLYVNGEDVSGKGIRDTEKILHQYLPDITHSLINSVIILGQGLPQKFTNNSPSGRKEVLEELSNSDFMISDLKNRVQKRSSELSTQIRAVEDNVVRLTTKIDSCHGQLEKLNNDLSRMTDIELNDYISQNKTFEDRIDFLKKEHDRITSEKTELEMKLSQANDDVSESLLTYNDKKQNLPVKDILPLTTKITEVNTQITSLSNEIRSLKNVQLYCPTCHQKLPDAHEIDTTDKENLLESLRWDLTVLQSDLNKDKEYNKNIINQFEKEFNESHKILKEKESELSNQLGLLNNELMVLNNDINSYTTKIETNKIKIQNFVREKEYIKDEIEKCKKELEESRLDLKENNLKHNDLELHRAVNNKMSNILKRDFRGYLLNNVIEFISGQAKQYSLDIFGTDKLDFYLDGNNIVIIYDGKDYEVLSGGEKQKVDVIIQLSIRDMLCKFLNFSSNILVLDEITDNLDSVGCQKMFNLISTKLNDVQAVYIITHHKDELYIPYDDVITVIKGNDKISRLSCQ